MSNSEDKHGRKLQAEGTVFAHSVLPEQRFKTLEGRGKARQVT